MRRGGSAGRDVGLIARREIDARLRQKGFLIGSAIGIAVVLVAAILPGVLHRKTTTHYRVAVVGTDAAALAASIRDVADRVDVPTTVDVRVLTDRSRARAEVRGGEIDAALIDGTTVVDKSLAPELAVVLDGALRVRAIDQAVASGELQRRAAAALTSAGLTNVTTLRRADSASERRKNLMFIGTILLYGQILTYGIWVAVGLVEEKSSRVIEVLLSTVRPRRLLAGKILGIGALGIGQLLAMAAVGLIGASAAGTVALPPGWPLTLGTLVGWFVLGYLIYACGFAVAASLVSRQEEMQGVQLPVTLLAVLSFLAATIAFQHPDGGLAVASTFFPPTAPFVVPLRMAADACPWWQAGAALALTVAACAAMVTVAARIYAGAALRTRGRTRLRTAWRGAE